MTNGKKDRLERTEELLQFAATQTVENARQIKEMGKEFDRQMKESREEHNREMKEIRTLFREMIKRIAV